MNCASASWNVVPRRVFDNCYCLWNETIALCIDDVSVRVCAHLPFILAFPTIENVHLKSLENQFRFVCPHFSSINSNCALRYLYVFLTTLVAQKCGELQMIFSNSLIIHEENSKEMNI